MVLTHADEQTSTLPQDPKRDINYKTTQIIHPVDKQQQGEKGDAYTQPLHTSKGRKGPSKSKGTAVLPWWEANSSMQPPAAETVPENREQKNRDIL